MHPTRRWVLASSLALTCSASAVAQDESVFTPEMFGAVGDGQHDDSAAMMRLSAAVNAQGGGTVVLRRTTYMVGGGQKPTNGKFQFMPADILAFRGCHRPLRIEGNGACLRSRPRLRYGVFDADGRASRHAMPYYGNGLVSPYLAMIEVAHCTGDIEISDIELAGMIDHLVIGGRYGDTGWQIPGTGLVLRENDGNEVVRGVHTHHHPLDGLLIDGSDATVAGAVRIIEDVVATANGRQGCSVVGGRGYRFTDCRFEGTGGATVRSAPGAGVDIEAENGKRIRDLSFTACRFANNMGPGLIADSGDSEGVRFSDCTFVGDRNWSAWPNRPHYRFDRCTFAGSLVRLYGNADPALAARFDHCIFTDDPRLSATGRLYGGEGGDRRLADLSDSANVLFDSCRFEARHGMALPWSTRAIYRDCSMVQGARPIGYPRGRFLGVNRINGGVDLNGSEIVGDVILNGVRRR